VFRVPGFEKEVRALWHHALVSGLYGKEVARIKRKSVEGQFLCGLLHGIGKPVVLQILNELKSYLKQPIDAAQTCELVDAYHSAIGSRLAELWTLPEQVRTAIAYYRRYEEAPNHHESTQTTYLVDKMAAWLLDPTPEQKEIIVNDPVLQTLNLYSDDVELLFNEADQVRSVLATIVF
jgi:HD-like signal output (HDOD) protein